MSCVDNSVSLDCPHIGLPDALKECLEASVDAAHVCFQHKGPIFKCRRLAGNLSGFPN